MPRSLNKAYIGYKSPQRVYSFVGRIVGIICYVLRENKNLYLVKSIQSSDLTADFKCKGI